MSNLEDSDPSLPPRPLPETTKSGEGDTVDIGQEDLVPREKRRMGDYLAYQTQQVFKNEYPIREGSESLRLRTATGNPAPISDVNSNAVKTYMDTFADESGQKARSTFESLSESGLLDTDTRFIIKKGKSDARGRTGTEIFREVDEQRGQAEVPRRIQAVMLSNNRFNEDSPAYRSGQVEGRGNNLGTLVVQSTLGAHAPQKFPKTTDGGEFVTIPIEKLKNFGYTLMLQASGEYNVPANLENPDEALGASATALAPGLARIGQRINVTRFDTVKILNEVEPTYKKAIRDDVLNGTPIWSYGNVNNPLAPFNGLVAASSISSAALLSLTVAALIKTLYVTLLGLDVGSRQLTGNGFLATEPNRPTTDRRLRLGNYYGKEDETAVYRRYRSDIDLDFVLTKYPYFQCVDKGIDVFFDVDGRSAGDAILNITANVQQSHGYYNVIFRNLIRSTSDMLLGTIQAGTTGKSAYDIDPNLGGTGNVAADITTTAVAYIKLINESKVLKFMNILALLGESAFFSEDSEISPIDAIVDVDTNIPEVPKLSVLHIKNRLSDAFGNKIAWGTGTIKSMYLLPAEIKTAATRYDGDDTRFIAMTERRGFKSAAGGRFSQDEVKSMENYLEADYMPFYFHDLRTNEIISFHAFLDSISDSYTVDYTENDGYGRIGKVLTYKNTNRSINMSFAVVATNPEDFDEMWYKVNKLITLLYPQYTQGRSLQFGGDSFVQPFSQLPAASPMMRLRLGDILKSNYNKFDLARIFGLSSAGFSINNAEPVQPAGAGDYEIRLENARAAIDARMREPPGSGGGFGFDDLAILIPNPGIPQQRGSAATAAYQRYANFDAPQSAQSRRQRAQLLDLTITSEKQVRITGGGLSIGTGRRRRAGIIVELTNPSGPQEEGEYVVPYESLIPDPDDVNRRALEQVGQPPETQADSAQKQQQRDAILNFFNPNASEPNPIFKSFESVRGRGLAGFIRSFNMEIDQSTQWETVGLNNRAPKMLKISMQFDPIHDLQPGIDHNGYNTAPVYNVGSWLKRATRDDGQAELKAREVDYSNNTTITTNRGGNS